MLFSFGFVCSTGEGFLCSPSGVGSGGAVTTPSTGEGLLFIASADAGSSAIPGGDSFRVSDSESTDAEVEEEELSVGFGPPPAAALSFSFLRSRSAFFQAGISFVG